MIESDIGSPHSPVPSAEVEVTAEWLRNALPSAFSSIAEETFKTERVGEEFGFSSRILRCRWDSGGLPKSVVVKLWSTGSPIGIREALFYRLFGEVAGARIPACFHAAVDSERKRGVLILEDFDAAVQGDHLQQLELDLAKAVARSLADLHATWVGVNDLGKAEWLPSVTKWEPESSWFESRRTAFIERFGDQLDHLSRSLLDGIERAPAMANDRMAGSLIVLVHGDLHLDNFLFKQDGHPVILDWARCARGPVGLDLADLLFEISKLENFEQILITYLNAFEEYSAVALDPAAIRSQLGGALLRKFAAWTCGIARWRPASSREAAMIGTSIERAVHSVTYWSTQDPNLFTFLK